MTAAPRLDDTHDPALRSWVTAAHAPDTDFPLQNLPFGVFRHDFEERPRVGIAIGDQVLDCLAAARAGCFDELGPVVRDALQSWSLNALMALGRGDARAVRRVASRLLRADTDEGRRAQGMRDLLLAGMDRVSLLVPAEIGDYTDFYASVYHATNVGAMFRPDNPLLPNYKWVPIGYHGRASSIVASGTAVRRPRGQTRPDPQRAAGVRALERRRLRTRARGLRVRRECARASRCPSAARKSGCSVSACSMTGRRATCRAGNTSRSAPFSRRTSRPPCRRGS